MHVPLLVSDFLARAALHHPDEPAVVDGAKRWTYAEFAARCWQLAHSLQALGLKQGDRLGLVSPNSHCLLEAFQAAAWLGVVVVPLNYRLAPDDFAWCLEHADAAAVLADIESCPALYGFPGHKIAARPHHPELPVPDGWLDYEEILGPSLPPARPELSEDDLLSLNYTSGTTARPKGVMLTHRNFYVNAYNYLTHFAVTRDDRYLWTLPMFHCNGWGGVYALTAVAATHVIVRTPAPGPVWQTLQDERITLACMAPVVLGTLLDHPDKRDLATRPRIVCAGAPPPAAHIQRVEHELGWTFLQIYGLTETSPIITFSGTGDAQEKARAGRAALNTEIRVVAPDGHDVPTDDHSVGEVLARGNMVFSGYWRSPEETDRVLQNGWFHTGDLATMRADGSIQLVDRAKDVIISGGENISSIEVEAVLYGHPDVLECAVVGVPDEKWGETPLAVVVARQPVAAEVLKAWLRERMAHFKVPSRYEFVDSLPRTATGKVQKFALREPYWGGQARRISG